MKYAIIEISGKQFWVETGKFYDFHRIPTELGKEIILNREIYKNFLLFLKHYRNLSIIFS